MRPPQQHEAQGRDLKEQAPSVIKPDHRGCPQQGKDTGFDSTLSACCLLGKSHVFFLGSPKQAKGWQRLPEGKGALCCPPATVSLPELSPFASTSRAPRTVAAWESPVVRTRPLHPG